MTKLGKNLIQAAKEARAIARGDSLVEEIEKAIWAVNDHPHIEGKDYAKAEAQAALSVILGKLREPSEELQLALERAPLFDDMPSSRLRLATVETNAVLRALALHLEKE